MLTFRNILQLAKLMGKFLVTSAKRSLGFCFINFHKPDFLLAVKLHYRPLKMLIVILNNNYNKYMFKVL